MTTITIQNIESLNHNVRRVTTEKPSDYTYTPGQATLVAIDKDGLRDKQRPFTFTSLPEDTHLEFTIKVYPSHEGVTDELDDLQPGDKLNIEDAWGAIQFQGKGTFIAGGAGITPMLAILRDQAHKHHDAVEKIIFSNKKAQDVFLQNELEKIANHNLVLTFTQEKVDGEKNGRVDRDMLDEEIDHNDQFFYVCGPPKMVESVEGLLKERGVSTEKIITEES